MIYWIDLGSGTTSRWLPIITLGFRLVCSSSTPYATSTNMRWEICSLDMCHPWALIAYTYKISLRFSWMACTLIGWLIGRMVGWLLCLLIGLCFFFGWLVGLLFGWLVGMLVVWAICKAWNKKVSRKSFGHNWMGRIIIMGCRLKYNAN